MPRSVLLVGIAASIILSGSSLLARDCRPLPFETCGEATDGPGPARRWGFDDNRYCPGGPGQNCVIPNGGGSPNPGSQFVDSTGCVFEMYVVADCGRELHLPLCDVESGTIRVLDPQGGPVVLHAANGAVTGRTCIFGQQATEPFREDGTEISWSAEDCDPFDGATTGGPGNFTLMDVWFTGEDDTLPGSSLCGVYTVQFESWAGCGWELFANCDGTSTPRFLIFDDACQAEAAVTPLPELVLDGLEGTQASSGCGVDYCVDVRNDGCKDPEQFKVVVREEVSGNSRVHDVPGLGAGQSLRLCGTLPVDSPDHFITVPIRAEVDPDDDVVECREVPQASSCDPATGADVVTDQVAIFCNIPPECRPGGPYSEECAGAVTPVGLDGSASSDADGDFLTFTWSTDCPGDIRDPASAVTVLDMDSRALGCEKACRAMLTVSDGFEPVSCETTVTVRDTTPPRVDGISFDGACLWPPNHKYVCIEDVASRVQAFDLCDPNPSVRVDGCSSNQPEDARDEDYPGANGDGHTLKDCVPSPDGSSVCLRSERLGTDPLGRFYGVTVRAVDGCGLSSTGAATVHVPHDQSPREKDCLRPDSPGER